MQILTRAREHLFKNQGNPNLPAQPPLRVEQGEVFEIQTVDTAHRNVQGPDDEQKPNGPMAINPWTPGVSGWSSGGTDLWLAGHPGFTYSFRAYAADASRTHFSAWSSPYSSTAGGAATPAPALSTTATPDGGVDLNWSGPADLYTILGGDKDGHTIATRYPSYAPMPLHLSGLATGIWQFVFYSDTSAMTTINVAGIALQGVGFTGPHIQHVTRDVAQTTYVWPEWWDEECDGSIDWDILAYTNHTVDIWGVDDHRYPVSYLRSTSTASSYISLRGWLESPLGFDNDWQIKASGGGYDFTLTAVVGGGDPQVVLNTTTPLPDRIDSQYMRFTWSMSTDGGGTWFGLGENQNQIYVTGVPADGAFETVLHLGCEGARNLNPDTQQADVVNGIWNKFSTGTGPANVVRVDRTPLTYYADYRTNNTETATLLQNGDGQCGSWASLLADTLRAQGATGVSYVTVTSGVAGSDGFLVGTWSFAGAGTGGAFPYLNTSNAFPPYNGAGTGYSWVTSEVTLATPLAGQNNPNPASIFRNHQILLIAGVYYDPSYGATYSSLVDMDTKAIGGFYRLDRVNGQWTGRVLLAQSSNTPGDLIGNAIPLF